MSAEVVDVETELATPAEAAIELRCSVHTVKAWCREARIDAVKTPGGEWRIPLAEIRRLYIPRRHVPLSGGRSRHADRGVA